MSESNNLIEFTRWLFKKIAQGFLLMCVFFCLVAGGIFSYYYLTETLPKKKVHIFVTVKHLNPFDVFDHSEKSSEKPANFEKDAQECSDDFPLYVMIFNSSEKTLEKVEFKITAKIHGHSSDISGIYPYYTSDKITEPNQGWGQCWKLNLRPGYTFKDDLDVNASISSVSFQ